MREGQPGWFYVGDGHLRYKDSGGWTEQYKAIEGARTSAPQVTSESPDPAGAKLNPRVKRHRRRGTAFATVVLASIMGVGYVAGLPNRESMDGLGSWATVQVSELSALVVPLTTASDRAAAPEAVAGSQVAAGRSPAQVSREVGEFDKAYASEITASLVDDIATADARFVVKPQIGTSTTMEYLSGDMRRLLDAGTPPVADKGRYRALVTTLKDSYARAAHQLSDDVVTAAATYAVARNATSELLALLNPALGTKYVLPSWSLR